MRVHRTTARACCGISGWAKLLDIAEAGTRREVERALDIAEQQEILDMRAIDDVLARSNGRHAGKVVHGMLSMRVTSVVASVALV